MIVGFTGSSRPIPERQRARLRTVLAQLRQDGAEVLHHGDCLNADEAAHDIWTRELGGWVEIHPPSDPSARAFCSRMQHDRVRRVHEPLPYLERNHRVAAAAGVLVAAPARIVEELRSGTWATVRAARRRGCRVILVGPDGGVDDQRADDPQQRLL